MHRTERLLNLEQIAEPTNCAGLLIDQRHFFLNKDILWNSVDLFPIENCAFYQMLTTFPSLLFRA